MACSPVPDASKRGAFRARDARTLIEYAAAVEHASEAVNHGHDELLRLRADDHATTALVVDVVHHILIAALREAMCRRRA